MFSNFFSVWIDWSFFNLVVFLGGTTKSKFIGFWKPVDHIIYTPLTTGFQVDYTVQMMPLVELERSGMNSVCLAAFLPEPADDVSQLTVMICHFEDIVTYWWFRCAGKSSESLNVLSVVQLRFQWWICSCSLLWI